MTKHDIEAVLKKYPNLTTFGFGVGRIRGESENARNERAKTSQNELRASDRCGRIAEHLRKIGKLRTINKQRNSYGLKHDAEKWIGDYCTNGEFICAAIHCGFTLKQVDCNAQFNMSNSDLKKLNADFSS